MNFNCAFPMGAFMASEYVDEGYFAQERYVFLMNERDRCTANALACLARGDGYLFQFWSKAARDFEKRARGEWVRPYSLDILRSHAK